MNDAKSILKMSIVALLISIGVAFTLNTETVREVVTEVPVGAVSTNQPSEPFYFQGGLTSKTTSFISTTTVACLLQNTTGATTTIDAFAWKVDRATTTTTVLQISTSTDANRFATSTSVASKTLATTLKGANVWVPTTDLGILGPGEWIKVGYGVGTTLPTVAQLQRGTCSVLFNNIQ